MLKRVVLVDTPSGGAHVIYRCPEIAGSQKLAMRWEEGEQKAKVLIETRGEGAYFLFPGSPNNCHETGKPYVLRRGSLTDIPVITAEERALLSASARSFNEYVRRERTCRGLTGHTNDGDRPGDDFNRRGDVLSLLTAHDWVVAGQRDEVTLLRRPGKESGVSATYNFGGSRLLYNFSTNGHPFEHDRAYAPFAVYALLKHEADFKAAARELARRGYGEGPGDGSDWDRGHEGSEPRVWSLYDLAESGEWPAEPQSWVVDSLIPKGGIGFLSGAPKDGKSLLSLDLMIHIAHGRPWLGRFPTKISQVLYVAREDPIRRLKERIGEINASYGYGPIPRDRVHFLIRERFHLNDISHIAWLYEQTRTHEFDFVVLDVLNRMIPGLDENNAKDIAEMVSILEKLNRELKVTILNIDHTRKPLTGKGSGRERQEPNPFDLKGSVAKYGAADFMLCLGRTSEEGRLQLYAENKDTDERPRFLIDVSPKASGQPKFAYAGSVDKLVGGNKAMGEANRRKVLEAMSSSWEPATVIAGRAGMTARTVQRHLNTLLATSLVDRVGETRDTKWRRSSDAGEEHVSE